MTLRNPAPLKYIPILPTDFAIVGGAAGFIDTDCTSVIPLGARIVVYKVYAGANQNTGSRAVGSAIDTKYNNVGSVWEEGISDCAGDGHLELYRGAANNTYKIMGYFANA